MEDEQRADIQPGFPKWNDIRPIVWSIAWLVGMLVFFLVGLPWLMRELDAIPLSQLPGLVVVGLGVVTWMLFRIERAVSKVQSAISDTGAATVKALGRIESDGELVRDSVESIHAVMTQDGVRGSDPFRVAGNPSGRVGDSPRRR